MSGDVLELETRRSIFEMVSSSPGLHMREISRRCDLKLSLVEYHIRALMENDLIVSDMEDGYKRFYISEDLSKARSGLTTRQKKKMHLLRQDVPLRIITVLLDLGPVPHKAILKKVEVSPSTLSYHLSRMKRAGIVKKARTEQGRCFVIIEPGEVLWLLMKGKIAPPTVVDGFISTWEEFY